MTPTLIIVARLPRAGSSKTRLIPRLGAAQSARLYQAFLLDTLDTARAVPGIRRAVAYLPANAGAAFARLAPDFDRFPQQGSTLGERLANGLARCLPEDSAVILGSDHPTLPAAHLAAAFDALRQVDLVINPTADGGYAIIGLRRPQPRLLLEVAMSTPHVTADTLALAGELGLRAHLLPEWYDVDTPADLDRLVDELRRGDPDCARHTRAALAGLRLL